MGIVGWKIEIEASVSIVQIIKILKIKVLDVIFMDLKQLTHLWRWVRYGYNLDLMMFYCVFRSDVSRKS